MPPPPLEGIRVLEVGNYMAGPFCGMQLADLGADVVKIEDPRGGDLSRRLEPLVDGESGNFVRLNRGKRSVALDLKQEAGAEIFRRLAERTDAIVENLRPGTMRGLMSVTGEEGGAPVKVGVSISDLAAGLYATIGVLAALGVREREGRGQLVDISMYESSVSLAVWESGQFFTTGEIPRAAGSAHKLVGPYQAVRAADTHFVLGATTVPTWHAFCVALGLERLEREPRFADGTLRRRNQAQLIPLIEAVTATRPAAHWLAVLRAAGVPCGEIQDYGQVFADPHLRERGFFVDLQHAKLGNVRALGTPLRLRSSPARLDRAGPLLGEHSAEVLREIGHSDDEVRAFVARGTVAAA